LGVGGVGYWRCKTQLFVVIFMNETGMNLQKVEAPWLMKCGL
jgi:hypothetical protein